MYSPLTTKHISIKEYITQNAMKFNFMTLLKLFERIEYPLEKIEIMPTNSLKSSEALIDGVRFISDDKVRVYVNDVNAAVFMDFVKTEFKYNYRLHKFFNTLLSGILLNYNTALYFEGRPNLKESFQNGDSLVAIDDINAKSYAYVFSFLERLYSEYNVSIFRASKPVATRAIQCELGTSRLDGNCVLGAFKNVNKIFYLVRFITEVPLYPLELEEIMERKELFKEAFKDDLDEINIIFENLITDTDLYSKLPLTMTSSTILVQGLVQFHCEMNIYTD